MISFWQDRSVLVTGATGLVGSWLVERLADAGADVVCLVRDWVPQSRLVRSGLADRVKVARGDIRDQGAMERVLGEHEIVTVFHLAAQTIVGIANRNPVSTFEANIQGTWATLEACRRSPGVKQVIMASSVSKSCADLIAHTYAVSYGLPVAITRCGNFYGGGDLNWNRIIPGTIRSALRGQRPVIRSDGTFIRDYFYVEDGAHAYMTLAEALAERPELNGEAFNFSNEIQVTVLDLVHKVLRLLGSDLQPDVRGEASNEIIHQYLSAEKARKVLGWSPMFDLDEGLRRTIAWYRGFLEHA
jgi:CDP-glucose 4,6-dehydratase